MKGVKRIKHTQDNRLQKKNSSFKIHYQFYSECAVIITKHSCIHLQSLDLPTITLLKNPNDGAWLNGCRSKAPSSVLVAETSITSAFSNTLSVWILWRIEWLFHDIWWQLKFQPWPSHLTESRDHWFEIWFTWMIWFAWMI